MITSVLCPHCGGWLINLTVKLRPRSRKPVTKMTLVHTWCGKTFHFYPKTGKTILIMPQKPED